tara:strand:- start:39 stop:365 length:327 start_codon:yes stop_codon:yes gene_type:complete
MANNFKSVEVTLANASEAIVIAATSNNQIMIGLNACNTSTTTSITLDVTLRDGSNDFKMVKALSIPPASKVEIVRGKYVLPTGYSLKAQSSSSSGLCDIVVGLLVDVS